ncbi:trimeric intracellular cation channel family protein [Flocculibacter collagenilyticus]|uniref:trimeric intracellular cation channel family protein n=1 Tax=Flocculibacter collagenilyticus TaxID=2744479 RepID=UPI0018F5252C|nr:trimeric intracellular cation channel family protein [Flocculibacter collagenilyticus]
MSTWFYWFDLIGVAVFAISGTLMAHEKKMDGFGVIVLASVTAIGGGTIRDVILDVPVFWVQDHTYLIAILCAAFITILWLRMRSSFPHSILLIADAMGLAFFMAMGTQKALSLGVTPFIAVVMGTITGVFGGVIRDVLAREVPLVLRGDLYATTCIAGGIVYTQCIAFDTGFPIAMSAGMTVTLLLRFAAIRWDWSLPVFK